MPTGTVEVDFGAFPGASDASVAVTGQTGILGTSLVEAWLLPADTADHTADEHWVEKIRVMAGNIVAGTGFTIYARNENQILEPLEVSGISGFRGTAATTYGTSSPSRGGLGTRLYGRWNVAWVWN